MGGYGSGPQTYGRWRSTVEQCTALDVNKLARDGLFRRAPHAGALTWRNTHTGEKVAAVGFRVERGSTGGLVLNLTYTKTPRGGDAVDVDESIRLTNTFPYFGGLRRWFVCPLLVNGQACQRRVGKLYLPPGQKYFGCRHCYDLTYQSCRDSRRFDSLYADLGDRFGVPGHVIGKILSGKW